MSTYSAGQKFAPNKTITWAELAQFKDGIPNFNRTLNGITSVYPSCLDVFNELPTNIQVDITVADKELFSANCPTTKSSFISDVFPNSREYTYIMTLNLYPTYTGYTDGFSVCAYLFTYDERGDRNYSPHLKLTPIINGSADTSKSDKYQCISKNDYWNNWVDEHNNSATAIIQIDTVAANNTEVVNSTWRTVHNIHLDFEF